MKETDGVNETIKALYKESSNHRAAVVSSPLCGCFFCLRTFPGADVTEWTDDGQTALCPHCDTDSVLPWTTDIPTLMKMHEHGFTWPIQGDL